MAKAHTFTPGEIVYAKTKYSAIAKATVVCEYEEAPRWGHVVGMKMVRLTYNDGGEFHVRKSRQFIMTKEQGEAFFLAQEEARKERERVAAENLARVKAEAAAFAKTPGGKRAIAIANAARRVYHHHHYNNTITHPDDELRISLGNLATALVPKKKRSV